MKKSDIALLIVIIAISLVASYFIGQAVLSNFTQSDVQVEATNPITSSITPPSTEIFNDKAINPAVPINIGDSNNQQPFGQ